VVTFLFTDVEGSTRRWEADADGMRVALAAHDAVLRAAIEEHDTGSFFRRRGHAPVRHLPCRRAKLEVDPRVTESSDTSDMPAKPRGYAGLRAELATLVDDFSPVINEPWPRLEDDKYRWELHSYGLPEGYDELVVADIIVLLSEALTGIGAADNKLLQAHTKADHHNPSSPDAA
jgi:hypothetical protein